MVLCRRTTTEQSAAWLNGEYKNSVKDGAGSTLAHAAWLKRHASEPFVMCDVCKKKLYPGCGG